MIDELRTERLTIRPWRLSDADRLLEIRRIPDVAKWLSNPDAWTTAEEAVAAIERWNATIEGDDVLGHWAVVPEGAEPVGSVCAQLTPDGSETTIGWYLHPEASGHGYAREASRCLLDAAMEADPELDRIWAVMWAENQPSAVVAAAIGMRDLGVLHDPWYGEPATPLSQFFLRDRYEV